MSSLAVIRAGLPFGRMDVALLLLLLHLIDIGQRVLMWHYWIMMNLWGVLQRMTLLECASRLPGFGGLLACVLTTRFGIPEERIGAERSTVRCHGRFSVKSTWWVSVSGSSELTGSTSVQTAMRRQTSADVVKFVTMIILRSYIKIITIIMIIHNEYIITLTLLFGSLCCCCRLGEV